MDRKYKILVVDDDKFLLELLSRTLIKAGAEAVTLNCPGKDFAEIVANIKPDLILMDVVMPEINGFQALHLLRAKKETESIPIIFESNQNSRDVVNTGIFLGAVDYLLVAAMTPTEICNCALSYLKNPQSYSQRFSGFIAKEQDLNEKVVEPSISFPDIEWWLIYKVGYIISAVLVFIGCYIYTIASYGFLFGVGLGWLPSIIVAAVASVFWPVILIGIIDRKSVV